MFWKQNIGRLLWQSEIPGVGTKGCEATFPRIEVLNRIEGVSKCGSGEYGVEDVIAGSVYTGTAFMLGTLSRIMLFKVPSDIRRNGRRRALQMFRCSASEPALESRQLLAAAIMTDQEQLLLELVNRARANPNAEATLYGVALNQGLAPGTITSTAKQPLTPHQILINIAGLHSQDMLDRDYFSHTTLGTTNGVVQRAVNAGYPTTAVGENIGWGGNTGAINQNQQVFDRHQALFLSPGHRQNMLHPPYNEAGMGVRYGVFTSDGSNFNAAMVTENFGIRNVNPAITGVVYTDLDANNFYSIGEAVRSGTVTAVNSLTGDFYTDSIGNSGSYSLNVPSGTYVVTASFRLAAVDYFGVSTVQVSTSNVKADFQSGNASTTSLTLSPQTTSVSETGTGSTVTMTVTRNGNIVSPLIVNLTTSDATEISVPVSITLPAGQSSVQFIVSAVNDNIIDGDQQTTIFAAATGFATRTAVLTTIDRSVPVLPTTVMTYQTPRPEISWTGVSNAASYEIWISNDSTGEFRFINHGGISSSTYTPSIDLPIGQYRVWVRGVTSAGLFSEWSTVQSMRIMTRPTIANPGAVHSSTSFELQWTSVPGAASYDVWIDHQSSSTSQYYRNLNVDGTSLQLSDFSVGRYSAWVRARNAAGFFGAWSPLAVVTVNVSPQLLNVTSGSFAAAPTVNWSAVPGASRYEVWINNISNGGGVFYHGNNNVSGNSYTLPALPAAGSYRVWVRARDSQGANFAWSTALDFEVNRPPRVLAPLSGGQSSTPSFSWTGVSGAVRYELWVSVLSPLTTRMIHLENLTALSYTPTSALNTGNYRTWIRAFDSSGAATNWSPGYDFSVAQQLAPVFSDATLPLLAGLDRLQDPVKSKAAEETSREDTPMQNDRTTDSIDRVFSSEQFLNAMVSNSAAPAALILQPNSQSDRAINYQSGQPDADRSGVQAVHSPQNSLTI